MNKETIRVALYARSATGEGLVDQVIAGRQIAESKGWEIVGEYIEIGSGINARRKEYLRLLEDMEQNKFDIIMTKSFECLSRGTLEFYSFANKLNIYNIRLFKFMENKFYEPEDDFITRIKEIMAEECHGEILRREKVEEQDTIVINGSLDDFYEAIKAMVIEEIRENQSRRAKVACKHKKAKM